MRTFGAAGALVGCGAGEVRESAGDGRDVITGPGGKFWRRHGWRVSLMIFEGLSELELSVLLGGDGRLGGRMKVAGDSCAWTTSTGGVSACLLMRSLTFGSSRSFVVLLKATIPCKSLVRHVKIS
jgi:hypothetical protein